MKYERLKQVILPIVLISIFVLSCNFLTPTSPTDQIPPTDVPTLEPTIDDEELIKAALAAHSGISESDLEITYDIITGVHAKGNFNQVGMTTKNIYLAAKVGVGWVIAYMGSSMPFCDEVETYNFPSEVISGCLDRFAEGYPTIEAALLARTGISKADLEYFIDVNTGMHVKGRIMPQGDEGILDFLAASVPLGWLVVYHGDGTPTCEQIDPYTFPMDFVPECIDAEGVIFDRAAADFPGIQAALAARTGLAIEELDFTIGINTGTHAWGNVRKAGTVSGGYYLAVKVGGDWLVAYDGQATPACSDIDPYLFPITMVPSCLDETLNVVDRRSYDDYAIRIALVEKTGIAEGELDYTIDTNTGIHAKGTVQQIGAVSGGHYLAAKVDDQWVVVFVGQDAPFCAEILPYNFPEEIVPFCQ